MKILIKSAWGSDDPTKAAFPFLHANAFAEEGHDAIPAERVFDAWLDPDTVRAWMQLLSFGWGAMDVRRVEIDARVGGRFTFSDMREGQEAVAVLQHCDHTVA